MLSLVNHLSTGGVGSRRYGGCPGAVGGLTNSSTLSRPAETCLNLSDKLPSPDASPAEHTGQAVGQSACPGQRKGRGPRSGSRGLRVLRQLGLDELLDPFDVLDEVLDEV